MKDDNEPPKMLNSWCRLPSIFFFGDSFSKRLNSKDLIVDLPSNYYELCYYKLSQPCTLYYYSCLGLIKTLYGLLAPFLLYLTLIMIYKKCHGFAISLITLICRLAFLSSIKFWKIQRILLLVYDII